MRVESEGGTAAWVTGTWTASATGLMALSESFFEPLAAGDQRPLWLVFLCYSTWSGIQEGSLGRGPSLFFGHIRHIKVLLWLGSYFGFQCARYS